MLGQAAPLGHDDYYTLGPAAAATAAAAPLPAERPAAQGVERLPMCSQRSLYVWTGAVRSLHLWGALVWPWGGVHAAHAPRARPRPGSCRLFLDKEEPDKAPQEEPDKAPQEEPDKAPRALPRHGTKARSSCSLSLVPPAP